MTIEAAIYARLADVTGTLYPLVGTRIYPVVASQDVAFPCVTWQRISEQRISAMGADTKIVRARIQIDGWSGTYDGARLLAQAIRERTQRWRTAGPPVIQDTFFLDASDERDEAASGATDMFRSLCQIELIYEE